MVLEFIDVFATKVRREPAAVEPMKIVIDEEKWGLPCNRAPPRKHSEEKQKEIRKQVGVLLDIGVIKESRATEWSQVHLVADVHNSLRGHVGLKLCRRRLERIRTQHIKMNQGRRSPIA